MHPCFVCQEIQHVVLYEPVIQLFAFTDEDWALLVPAGVALCLAGDAPWLPAVLTVWHAVPTHTSPTHVVLLHAVVGQVAPFMAL